MLHPWRLPRGQKTHRPLRDLSACCSSSSAVAARDDPVLAKVGDTEITASQLDVFVGRVSLDLLSDEEGVEADRDYLESMIDQELLVQEARSRGLDTSSVVTHQLEAAVRHRFYQRYLGEFVNPKIAITPTEIERAFHDMGFDRERLVSRILLNGTEMEARAVLAQIEEGRPFADVLEEHGDSDPLADDSGKISWVGVTSLKKLRIPPDEFRSLSLNEPLLIKLSPGVWGIVRFEEDREANIQHYQGDLIKILRQEEWWRRTNEEAEVLGQKYGARSSSRRTPGPDTATFGAPRGSDRGGGRSTAALLRRRRHHNGGRFHRPGSRGDGKLGRGRQLDDRPCGREPAPVSEAVLVGRPRPGLGPRGGFLRMARPQAPEFHDAPPREDRGG